MMERTRTLMALASLLANVAGCVGTPYDEPPVASKAQPPASAPQTHAIRSKPEFVRAANVNANVEALVRSAAEAAQLEARRLVVYVGAPWCEPCTRFHEAIERGELDGSLAGIRFLEFDADQHTPALDAAGYGGRLIPRFALPDRNGRGTDQRIEGGVKGEQAVAHIMRRLGTLLAT